MMNITVSVIRKHASVRLSFVTSKSNLLAILQIFESTSDVENYIVTQVDDRTYEHKDLYIPNSTGFEKWIPLDRPHKD